MSAAASEDILGWLNSAIAGRERVAGDAASEAGGTWSEDPFVFGVRDEKNALVAKSRDNRASSIVHIALNDPASVLRRCAADRKLLELHGRTMHSCPAEDETGYLDEWTQFGFDDVCPVVRLLAEGYGWTGGNRPTNRPECGWSPIDATTDCDWDPKCPTHGEKEGDR